jgi:glycosyltransferase involved in cell wall biosynthesis
VKNAPPLRALFVISALGIGGAETWIMALLQHFAETRSQTGLQIDICLTSGMRAHFDERARQLGAKLFYLEYSRRQMPSFIAGMRTLLRSGRYDVIHDHQDYHAGFHLLAGLGQLPPSRVVHIHNPYVNIESVLGSTATRRAALELGRRLVQSLATDVLGTSREVISDYRLTGAGTPRSSVVHCGFDVDPFAGSRTAARNSIREEFGWTESEKVMLFVGRLDGSYNQKNHPFATAVAVAAVDRDQSVKLLIAGAGEREINKARHAVSELGLSESIRFLGPRNDVPRLMLGSDLLLFPSIAEGLGMVAVEAQAAGLRVLASDRVPRECEVVPDSVQFTPLEYGVHHWVDQALAMLELPPAPHVEWNEQVRVSPFSIEQSAAGLIRVYEEELRR